MTENATPNTKPSKGVQMTPFSSALNSTYNEIQKRRVRRFDVGLSEIVPKTRRSKLDSSIVAGSQFETAVEDVVDEIVQENDSSERQSETRRWLLVLLGLVIVVLLVAGSALRADEVSTRLNDTAVLVEPVENETIPADSIPIAEFDEAKVETPETEATTLVLQQNTHLLMKQQELIDQLMQIIRPIKYPDYALSAGGARILYDKTSASYAPTLLSKLMPTDPAIVLNGQNTLGNCWPCMPRSNITILLSRSISIRNITMFHVSKQEALYNDVSSQPQLVSFHTPQESLGEYLFEGEESVFKVHSKVTRVLTIELKSNYGSEYSCLYRVAVSGERNE